MAGRKNSTFKSILVALLSVCAVIQTGMLWLDGSSGHNFFYYIKEKSLYKTDNSNPVEAIKPTDIYFGTGDGMFRKAEKQYDIEKNCSEIIKNAIHSDNLTQIPAFDWSESLDGSCFVYEFDIPVPFNEYVSGIGESEKHMPSFLKTFTRIVISGNNSSSDGAKVYFVDTQGETDTAAEYSSDNASAVSALISAAEKQIKENPDSTVCISTALSGFNIFSSNIFVPQFNLNQNVLFSAKEEKCIDFSLAAKDYIEEKTDQYFGKYSARNVTTEVSGVCTISDSTTVVKCYPSGMLEYFSYGTDNTNENQSLSSAYYACIKFLKADTSLKTGYRLKDVTLTGEGLKFCFDYYTGSMPVILSDRLKDETGSYYALEVTVNSNSVRKFKKYNSNFISSETADTAPTIDFLTAVNYAMALNGTDGAKINDISLGYYANGDSINISWFVKIENTTYIVDALNGNISIK